MKKLIFTLVAVAVALSASAAVNVRAVQAKAAQPEKSMKIEKTLTKVANVKGPRVNEPGNSIATREFGDPVDTCYYPPVGTFYSAPFIDENYWTYYYYYVTPSGVELTWRNSSVDTNGRLENADYFWTYTDKFTEDGYVNIFEGEDLNTTYNGSIQYIYRAPILSIGSEEAEDSYQFREGRAAQFRGGTLTFAIDEIGDDNLSCDFIPFNHSELSNSYVTSKSEEVNERWTTDLNEDHYYSDADGLKVYGIAEYLPYVGHDYTISRVKMPAYVSARAGAEVKAKIVVRDEDGTLYIDQPVAESTYVFDEDTEGVDDPDGSAYWYDLDFVFETIDEHGLVSEEPIVINNDAFVIIDGAYEDDNVLEFHPILNQYEYGYIRGGDRTKKNYVYDNNAVVILKELDARGRETGGICVAPANGGYFWGSGEDINEYKLPSNFCMSFDLAYPFLDVDEEEVEFVKAGETKEILVSASSEFDSWSLAEDLPDWLSIEGEDEYEESDDDELFTGNVTLTITADALPESEEGRTFDLTYEIPAAKLVLKIKQGDVEEGLLGDVNGDKAVDVKDVTALIQYCLGKEPEGFIKANADLTGEGEIDVKDVTALINLILK